MRSLPPRRMLLASLGLLGAAVPATALTVALWPSPESAPESEAGGENPAATRSVLDEIRDLRQRTVTPASTTDATATEPTTPRERDVTVARSERVRPTAEVDAADSRAEMVERRAMEPHPLPPQSPVIAPGIQSSIDASDEDPIDLGTLVPPDEPAYSPSQQRP